MIISTIACNATLPFAALAAKTAKRHMSDARTVLCLVEENGRSSPDLYRDFDEIVLAKYLGFDLYRHVFKFNRLQYAVAVKGQWLEYVLRMFGDEEEFIYIDDRMYVLGPFDELREQLREAPILIAPHHLEPSAPEDVSREIGVLKDGTFHGGLVAVRSSDEARTFAKWWSDMIASGYKDPYGCLFTDQKYLNFVPSLFDAGIIKHPGYNVAFWNLHESCRQIRHRGGGLYTAADQALRCFHFSNSMGLLDGSLRRFVPDADSDIYGLRRQYMEELNALGGADEERWEWSYDRYAGGEPIREEARAGYRDDPRLADLYPDPFAASNECFY